jgi:hypothetical protein
LINITTSNISTITVPKTIGNQGIDACGFPTMTAQIPNWLVLADSVIELLSRLVSSIVHWPVDSSQRAKTSVEASPSALSRSAAEYFTLTTAFLARRPVNP